MEEHEVRRLFERFFADLTPQQEFDARHPDYVMEMPQSGERIRTREAMRAFQEAYPDPPSIVLRRIVGAGDVWVVEATSDYSGHVYEVVDIVEFEDGRIRKETRYYAEPFEAPAWRAQWVEPIEDAPQGR